MTGEKQESDNKALNETHNSSPSQVQKPVIIKEVGGPRGLEPTRYGDWERNGRCIDF